MTGENEDFSPICCTATYYVEVKQLGAKVRLFALHTALIQAKERTSVVTVFFV